MKIRPLRTIPLRLALKLTGWRNASSKKRIGAAQKRYSIWSAAERRVHPDSSLEATIHPYPGLGHQLSGWIAGELWSRDLDLVYAGGKLTQDRSQLFAFVEVPARAVSERGKTVRLKAVNDETDPRSLAVLRGQVQRASARWPDTPIRFQLALDQARWDQSAAEGALRKAVLLGSRGDAFAELENDGRPYVALHIRRGDVSMDTLAGDTGQSRWVDEGWYVNIVRSLRRHPGIQGLEIRAYALGQPDDFQELADEGVSLRLGGDRDLDFIEMAAARVLVVAPSSFSFSAGLVSKGVVIAQVPWWHRVPNDGRWVGVGPTAVIDQSELDRALSAAANCRQGD
jgi:hypothetical protein